MTGRPAPWEPPGPAPGPRPAVPLRPPVLLFDGDCGLCTSLARMLWQVVSRDRFEIRPWQRVAPEQLARWGLTAEDCARAVQLVDGAGEVSEGHHAVVRALQLGHRFLAPVARLAGRPELDAPLAAAYGWVSDHRHQLPGGTAACRR